jgi:parallel beta-helix repeat protein
MPTIDELPAAPSVGDSDAFMVSQSGISRKAARSQINAGLQPQIFLPQGSLLGRMSAGTGGPETIAIGANLTIAAGSISAPAPFAIDDCATGRPVQATDLVPLEQGGHNVNLAYAAFMSGIAALTGINASGLAVTALGAPQGRSLAAIAADAMPVEAFGAAGDGATDDTAAFQLALASGKPLRLDAKVYVINGVLSVSAATCMIGVAQGSIIRRLVLTNGGSWISVAAGPFCATGIIFDAGSLAAADAPALFVGSACAASLFCQCIFQNATGTTSGSGIAVQTSQGSTHVIAQCTARNNAQHGMSLAGAGTVTVSGCIAQANAGYGISVGNGVAATIAGNTCNANQCGISVGAWNTVPFTRSTATPVSIRDNQCSGNSNWGIAAACTGALIDGNALSGNGSISIGGGLLGRLAGGRLRDNIVSAPGTGIDCRCGSGCQVVGNAVSNAANALLVGGSQNVLVSGNFLTGNIWGIVVSAIEPTLGQTPTSSVNIEGNWIGFTLAQGGGISVLDGAQGIAVIENRFNGSGSATVDQALWIHTDQAIVRGNSWNNTARFTVSSVTIADLPTIIVPDVADEVLVLSAPPGIQSILTGHQANTLGQISFVRVLNGGTNYTQAGVTIAGYGSGAKAQAVLANGSVIWIVMTNPGSGYGAIGAAVTVTISGDGTGATAQGYVGVPVIEGKTLRIACNTAMRLVQAGSAPPLTSWTGFDTTVPAFGAVELEGTFGQWRAVENPPVDYVLPTGNGGAIFQSVSGADLTLCPSEGGALQITSAQEPSGYTMTVGRGSPEGAVAPRARISAISMAAPAVRCG